MIVRILFTYNDDDDDDSTTKRLGSTYTDNLFFLLLGDRFNTD